MDTLKSLFDQYNSHKNDKFSEHYIEKIKHTYKKHSIEIENTKTKLTKSIDDLSDMFNTVLLTISDILEKEYKNDIKINLYNTAIKSIVERKKKEPISVFLLKIYNVDKYRTNILQKNDDFFTDVDNHKDAINGSEDKMTKLFMFKEFWGTLDESLKNYIRNACITLVKICDNYINAKVELNDLTEIMKLSQGS